MITKKKADWLTKFGTTIHQKIGMFLCQVPIEKSLEKHV